MSVRCWTLVITPGEWDRIRPSRSPVADAVAALGTMTRAGRLRFGMSASPWELAVTLTGLLYARPRDPPGF